MTTEYTYSILKIVKEKEMVWMAVVVNVENGNGVRIFDFISKVSLELTNKWQGKRFEDIADVHSDIQSHLQEALKEFGIKDMCVTNWAIKSHDLWEDVFRYAIEMKQDKRFKWRTKGTVRSISVFSTDKVSVGVNSTVNQLLRELNVFVTENRIQNVMKQLSEAYTTVSELETALKELQETAKNI